MNGSLKVRLFSKQGICSEDSVGEGARGGRRGPRGGRGGKAAHRRPDEQAQEHPRSQVSFRHTI